MTGFTSVSADPLHQLVDHGFPLYRFGKAPRKIKVLGQSQMISRNNNYRPTPFITKNHISTRKYLKNVPDLGNEFKSSLINIIWQDMHDIRKLEELDPLKGNSLVMTDELVVFSAGPSLSNLVSAIVSNDQVTIIHTIDLEYPIRQITSSRLNHHSVLVRTTSSIHLVHINQEHRITPIHRLFLPSLSEINPKLDYSMPIHVEPSPFYDTQYLFTTTNGFIGLMDTTTETLLFEHLDPIPSEIKYRSRWRSCGFGKSPFTIYTASPECIKEFVIRKKSITSSIIAIPNERIVAFKTTQDSLFCFATTTSIVIMDALHPERPLVTWLHRMRDGAPTDILIDQLIDHKWRITAFSKHTQRFTMISLHYVNNPGQNFKPTVKILELFNFTLPLHRFEEIFNYTSRVNSVGCTIHTVSNTEQDTTEGNVVLSIYRAFEDGSIQLNYIELTSNENTDLMQPIKYQQTSLSSSYDQLMSDLKTLLRPVAGGRGPHMPEVIDVKTDKLNGFLNSIQLGDTPLTDAFKKEIAGKVEDLTSTITFRELFEDEEYQKYSLQDLNDFLDIMEIHEQIERGRQPDTFGIYHKGKPTDLALHEKLNRAHEKEMHLSSVMIRPSHKADNKFRYLDPNIKFQSTTTSKLLSALWTMNNTRHDQLEFPQYTPDRLLEPEKFHSVNIYQSLLEEEPTVISLSQPIPKIETLASESTSLPLDHVPVLSTTPKKRKQEEETPSSFSAISTQPLPGVFGSRTKKPAKKKSKPKSSGFK